MTEPRTEEYQPKLLDDFTTEAGELLDNDEKIDGTLFAERDKKRDGKEYSRRVKLREKVYDLTRNQKLSKEEKVSELANMINKLRENGENDEAAIVLIYGSLETAKVDVVPSFVDFRFPPVSTENWVVINERKKSLRKQICREANLGPRFIEEHVLFHPHTTSAIIK